VDLVTPRRFEVWLVSLDPALGAEIRKTRPCVIVSPDEANRHLKTVLVAPLTTTLRRYPSRVRLRFRNREGEVALDQMRAIDGNRLLKRLGALPPETAKRITATLLEYFA
jgi:mRNA interferase MazF